MASAFGEGPLVQPTSVTPDYFRTMGIPLLNGRILTNVDTPDSTLVVVINEALARHFWPGQNPLGKRMNFGGSSNWLEIVGIVGNSRRFSVSADPMAEVYFSHLQNPDANMKLIVRSALDAGALTSAIRAQISGMDGGISVYDISTMERIVAESTSATRYIALLMTIFALVAMILAGTGIYGVISYSVMRQTHEIGVRMALGAERRDVLRGVVRKGALLSGFGLAGGFAAALALTRVLTGMIYGVERTDPATFAAVALLLAAISILACYVPARRATRVDPMEALRCE